MTYSQNTTDASKLYRQNSAATSSDFEGTAVKGNMSDLMKNSTVVKATFVVPTLVHYSEPGRDTNLSPTYSPVW